MPVNAAAILTKTFPQLAPEFAAEVFAAPRARRCALVAERVNLSPADVAKRLAATTGTPFLETFAIAPEADKKIPLRLVHEYQALPIAPKGVEENAETLPLVTNWPAVAKMDAWVFALTGKHPLWHIAPPEVVDAAIQENFGVGSGSLDSADLDKLGVEGENEEVEDENAAIIRFINEIITKAATDRATDIHFEPQKDSLIIRYRIDGELVLVRLPDNLVHFQAALVSRLKIMAKLNISERRRPQDGRIHFRHGSDDIDIRVSTLPTLHGESVSLRLLGTKAAPLSIRDLGFLPDDEARIVHQLERPHGIILVTGPTGSGKSTTLNAFLRRILRPELRIMTVEDPVEYEVPTVNQTQVQSDIGLTFASVLRSILRQDPDVIMVGEIRDRETADIAIRASLTGHLVLSTLHTNDAAGALTRLTDMGIEPFLIASSVELIIAQRLVRRLCARCAKPLQKRREEVLPFLTALGIPHSIAQETETVHETAGCDYCRDIGYKGRVGIFEILPVSESVHDHIVNRSSAREIHEQALKEGMRTLQRCGWEQVRRGVTTLAEIMTYAEKYEE
ncbi:MAG: type II/IV secretion system protein [Puniceicoccales bacterium]|jgi:type II secretory ATPase GspE/PulE/Tfp pilus assembly ATPase PilB-like protein|nr:type II/IV secretion system protein [Puniceicoccales bacterium]